MTKAAQTVRTQAVVLASAARHGRRGRLVEALSTLVQTLAAGCRINESRKMPPTYQLLLAVGAVTAEAAAPRPGRPPARARPNQRATRSAGASADGAHRSLAHPPPARAA